MNLPQINNYAKEFHKQLKKTHPHLKTEDIFAIMAIQFTSLHALTPEYRFGEGQRVLSALAIVGELAYTSLLNDEEFEKYQKDTEEKRNAIRQSRSAGNKEEVRETIIVEQANDVSSNSGSDQHSDEIRSPQIRYPY